MRACGRIAADRDDEGTILILLIFFVLIIAGLITVVVDVSTLFLAQRELQAAADAAVQDAAQHPLVESVYGGAADALPLTQQGVVQAIESYLASSAHRPHDCAASSLIVTATLDGDTAAVTVTCDVPLPFVKLVDESASHKVTVSSRARLIVSQGG